MATTALPTTGVVLAALDEFSANMKAYVAGLEQVDGKTQQSTSLSERSTGATRKQAEAHALGVEKMARYAMGVGIVSGQLQSMGISAEKTMLPMTILISTMTEGFNPTGLVMIGLGAMASAVLALATAHKRAEESILASGTALASLRAATGVQTAAERELIEATRAITRHELLKAQASITAANAEYAHAAALDRLALAQQNASPGAGDQPEDYIAAATNHLLNKNAAEQHAAALGKLTLLQAQLKQQMEALNLALTGGSEGHAAATAAANERTTQLDDMAVAIAAHDAKITGITAAGFAKRTKQFTDFVAVQFGGFQRVTAAGTASAEMQTAVDSREAQKREAILQHQVELSLQAGALIGSAIGGAIAGTTDVWRTAAVAALGIVKREIEAIITLHALITPWILVKLGAVEAIFAAATSAIQGGSHAPTPVHNVGGPTYGGGATTQGFGYQGGYYYAPTAQSSGAGAAPVSVTYQIHQEFHGAGDPAVQRVYTRETEDLLYRLGPEAARRAKALGRPATRAA